MNLIKNLKNKTPGIDKLRGKPIKTIYPYISKILIHIYNSCLRTSYFLNYWKIGNLIVVPKNINANPNIIKNYRPISLLSDLGKILYSHLRNKFYSNNQFGFCSGKSTIDALYSFKRTVNKFKPNFKFTAAIFFDISGAFDNVWYPSVIRALRHKNVDINLINLIKNYFTNRLVKFKNGTNKTQKYTKKG